MSENWAKFTENSLTGPEESSYALSLVNAIGTRDTSMSVTAPQWIRNQVIPPLATSTEGNTIGWAIHASGGNSLERSIRSGWRIVSTNFLFDLETAPLYASLAPLRHWETIFHRGTPSGPVTAEVASSSLVVPAILSQKSLLRFRVNHRGPKRARFRVLFLSLLAHSSRRKVSSCGGVSR